MMFLVHFKGAGEGCDYTIGCNQKTMILPDSVTTMKQALDHIEVDVLESLDMLRGVTVYEVSDIHEYNISAAIRRQRENKRRNDAILTEARERTELERLQQKYNSK